MENILRKEDNTALRGDRLLDVVNFPEDFRDFSNEQLKKLSDEVREEIINIVSKTGGHLGASLGVVELSVAIHAVFDTPKDRLIWDVGHQCYPHKILTGRKNRMNSIRQENGLSGFTKRKESEYDPFGAGHSSTSISAGLGMAMARDLAGDDNDVIAVIGDGAMTAGMAYEAMNNAGDLKNRMIVILNDNDMSISKPVGALSRHLTKIVSSNPYIGARDIAKQMTNILPTPLKNAAAKMEESARLSMGKGSFFEDMGFYYIGPVDGHDMEQLLTILRNVKNSKRDAPILIHAVTKKGKGYAPAEISKDKMHGVAKFDIATGNQNKPKIITPSYTKIFADSLIKMAKKDDKIVAITAAMDSGTGLDKFAYEFPEKSFDVGIAEQHAVTFAAGMAVEGYKPFVAIYSTFLQRAYDQIIHDVCIQNLPVRFAIDRAGLVGADGQTHAGSFDIAYLSCLPNMVIMAPCDEAELASMVATAASYDDGPIAFRYPRGEGIGKEIPDELDILDIGKGRIVKEGSDIAIISLGTRLGEVLAAAEMLQKKDISVTIADARFAKPLDREMILELAKNHGAIITIEEGSSGGFGSSVLKLLSDEAMLDKNLKIRTMNLPDYYQNQASQDSQYKEAGLCAENIFQLAVSVIYS